MEILLTIIQSLTILIIYYYLFTKNISKTNISIISFNFLFLYHLLFTLFYIFYSTNNISDSYTVWHISQISKFGNYIERITTLNNYEIGRGASILLSSFFYKIFSFTFFSMTILYSLFSLSGILLLYGLVNSYLENQKNVNKFFIRLFFLFPSLHFWTVSVSKDAVVFFSICLFISSVFFLKKKLLFISLSLIIMFLFRPYIAIVFLFFIYIDFLFAKNFEIKIKSIIFIFSFIIFAYLFQYSLGYIGIGSDKIFNFTALYNTISTILSTAREVAQTQAGYIDIEFKNIFHQYYVYLFFPIFFYFENLFYLVASIENILLLIYITILIILKKYSSIHKNEYILFFIFLIILTILSVRTMNYGISMRQKWLILPLLYIVLINKFKKSKNA